MALNTKIFDLLRGTSALTAYTSTRIYPVMMPQSVAAFPALLYSRVSADGIYSLAGYTGKEKVRYSVDILATDYDDVRAVADLTHSAMTGSTSFACIRIAEGDSFDPELELYLVNQIYSIIGGT
jgi:hypothetical protein